MNVKFRYATLFLLSHLLFGAANIYGEEPCLNTIHESNPIDDIRDTGTVSVTSSIVCETDDDTFLITDPSLMENLSDMQSAYCIDEAEADPTLCEDEIYFNFKRHPEKISEFIDYLRSDLETIPLPNNANSLKEGTSITDIEIQAMMFLCTTKVERDFVSYLKNPEISETDKLNAIERYKVKDLFKRFMNSPYLLEVIEAPAVSETIKKHLINEALSYNYGKSPLKALLATRLSLERRGANESVLNLITNSITEYMNGPNDKKSLLALNLLMSEDFPGAREALQNFTTAAVTDAIMPNRDGDVAPIPLLTATPDCSQTRAANLADKRRVQLAMTNFLKQQRSVDSTVTPLESDAHFLTYFATNFDNNERWTKLETQITLSNDFDDTRIALDSARAFFCYNKEIYTKLQSLNDRSTQRKDQVASEILSLLETMNGDPGVLEALNAIVPHLSDREIETALSIMKEMGTLPNVNNNEVAEGIRINVLKRIFDRYSDNIRSGAGVHENAREAINVLALNGGKRAEETIADFFVLYDSTQLRVHLLNQYKNPAFLNNVSSNFSIIERIQNLKTARATYARHLTNILRGVSTTNGFEGTGAANERDNVRASVRDGLLNSLSAFVSSGVGGDLADGTNNSLDLVDGRPGQDTGNFGTKPIAFTNSPTPRVGSPNPKIGSPFPKTINDRTLASSRGSINQINITPSNSPSFNAKYDDLVQQGFEDGLEQDDSALDEIDKIRMQKKLGSQEATGNGEGGFGEGTGGSGGLIGQGQKPNDNNLRQPTRFGKPIGQTNSQNGFSPVLPSNQTDFFTGLGNNILPNTFNSPMRIPEVGEISSSSASKDSFDSQFRSGGLNKVVSSSSAASSTVKDYNSTSSRIDRLAEEAKSLRQEIERRDELEALPIERNDNNPFMPQVGQSPSRDKSGYDKNNRVAAVESSAGRGPASVTPSGLPPQQQSPQRGPASVNSGDKNVDQVKPTPANPGDGKFTAILSPIDDLSKEDLSKVVKITDPNLKDLLMNYMSERESLTCPELRFVQDFYERHVDKFILSKKRKPWREYALVEMEDLTFRFNYPGGKLVQSEIKERCENLSRDVSSVGEEESGISENTAKKDDEEIVEKVLPAESETNVFKSFMLKLGL